MDIPECIAILDIQQATLQDEPLVVAKNNLQGCPISVNEIPQELRPYYTFKDDLVVIDGIVLEGRYIIIPEELQK